MSRFIWLDRMHYHVWLMTLWHPSDCSAEQFVISLRIDLRSSLWIRHMTCIYEFIVAVMLCYKCTHQGFQITGIKKSGSTLTGQENATPTALQQTSAQLLNYGVQLSIGPGSIIRTQSARQCWWCLQLRNNGGMKQIKHRKKYWTSKEKLKGQRNRETNWRKKNLTSTEIMIWKK